MISNIDPETLRLFRLRHGISTTEFCKKYKIQRTAWQTWESGTKPPSGTVITFLLCIMREPKLMEKIINEINDD